MTTGAQTKKHTMILGCIIVALSVACSPIKGTAGTYPDASSPISPNTEKTEKAEQSKEEISDGTFLHTDSSLVIPRADYRKAGAFDFAYMQSFDVFGNLLVAVAPKSVYRIYDINTFEVLKTGILPNIGTTKVHGNMCSFGNEVLEGSSIPLLYVSHWDGDKGVVVYSISSDDLTATQVQKIIPSEELKSSSTFGVGNTDFTVDAENGFLYSVCYKENRYTEGESNKTCICKFLLPKVSQDSTVMIGRYKSCKTKKGVKCGKPHNSFFV